MKDASPTISPSDARQIDRICDRFEAAWKAGQKPPLAEFIATVGKSGRSGLLRHLLLLDWDYRRRNGDNPQVLDYRTLFPDDATLVEAVGREMIAPADHAAPPRHAASGRYELAQEVGRGGIGIVYRGRDRHLGRDLAVKVLNDAHCDSPDARRRFLAEARVGSQLQHPAIVPVYELGSFDERRPYFTMKLVEGHTLAELLHARSDPSQDLPRMLDIFEQVCQAMAYAHARGVVHRDLKPSNVMVGAFGEVQVMDWGFAKQLQISDCRLQIENTEPPASLSNLPGVTQSGAMMGSPAYMPPEQAQGLTDQIDSRSDVFALGAILCEILTAQTPYWGVTALELCGKAANADLREAHSQIDACGADEALRALAKRCLTAERMARPADAGIVAQELTTYLASAQERLRQAQLKRAAAEARATEGTAKVKAERRARRMSVALAAALLIGFAVAAWQAFVAVRAKDDAIAAKETATSKEAETSAIFGFVQDRILAAARPEGQGGGLGHDVSLRKALESALPYVNQSFANQPLTEARLRMTLGKSFFDLGDGKLAADQYQRARAIFSDVVGPDHTETLASINNLALSFAALGRHAEALPLREETLAILKTKLGSDHANTLTAMNNLALSYSALGRHAQALKLREETFALLKTTLGAEHPTTLAGMNNLARSLSAVGRHADALKLREDLLPLMRTALGPDHPQTLASMSNLASSYYALARYDEAATLAQQALARQQAKLGHDHPDTFITMSNLAASYHALGRHDDALKLAERTLALRKAKHGPDHPQTLLSMINLAAAYTAVGRHAEALELRATALAQQKLQLTADHPDTLASMWDVAASLVKLDRGAEAVPIIDECVRRVPGKDVDPKLIPGVMDLRLRHFELANDPDNCRATAEMWENLNRTDAASLHRAACYRAVTAKVIRAAAQSSGAAIEAEAEADRAIAWLKAAIAAGYKNGARLKQDVDLDALRDRADFQKLLGG